MTDSTKKKRFFGGGSRLLRGEFSVYHRPRRFKIMEGTVIQNVFFFLVMFLSRRANMNFANPEK